MSLKSVLASLLIPAFCCLTVVAQESSPASDSKGESKKNEPAAESTPSSEKTGEASKEKAPSSDQATAVNNSKESDKSKEGDKKEQEKEKSKESEKDASKEKGPKSDDKKEMKESDPKKDPSNEKNPRDDKNPKDEKNKSTEPEKTKEPVKPSPPPKPVKKPLPRMGDTNNQMIPGQPWHIHDRNRPRPLAVAPGSTDDAPPADAVVLFDGTSLSEWCHRGTEDELFEPMWKIEDGYLEIVPNTGNLYTIDSFGSCQLHLEWQIPEGIQGTSQGRGNSGVKLMERYELQILDSFKSRTYADGQAGAIYGQYPPQFNVVRPQGQWQSFDAYFEAPVYEGDKLIKQPYITLMHNGVFVHHRRELSGPTGAMPDRRSVVPPASPLMLQDHGNAIRFRNIWIRPL